MGPGFFSTLTRLTLALVLVGASTAQACTIPVFRYALDRWGADLYMLDVPANPDPEAVELLAPLRSQTGLNLKLNLSEALPEPNQARLLAPADRPAPVWEGTLDATALERITRSPARAEIVKRILEGQAAVWVMVEGPDAADNEAAAQMLEARLKYLNSVAEIPVQDPTDPENHLGPGPALRVEFSLLRVDAGDPREAVFVPMLAGPIAEQLLKPGKPWVAPVFGRGRALGAWAVHEMEVKDVDDLSLFLLGACSCQVKQQNPGWDLLLTVNWEEALLEAGREAEQLMNPQELPPLAALEPLAPLEPETVTFNAEESTSAPASTPKTATQPTLASSTLSIRSIFLAGLVLVLSAVFLILLAAGIGRKRS